MSKNLYEKITTKELYAKFELMFPKLAEDATGCSRIGSRVISIRFKNPEDENNDKSLVFLYINDNNWQLGTKLWRKRPNFLSNKNNIKKEEDQNETVDE